MPNEQSGDVPADLKERAMDEAPVGITISDPDREDNPLVYVNDAFERITGYPREVMLGRNCRFLGRLRAGPRPGGAAPRRRACGGLPAHQLPAGRPRGRCGVRPDLPAPGGAAAPRRRLRRRRVADVLRRDGRRHLRRTRAHRGPLPRGRGGHRYLPEDVQFGVLLSAVLYAEHHRLIRQQAYDVLSRTPSLSTSRRLLLTARIWYHWQRSDDPEAVFERVSAIPSESPAGSAPGAGSADESRLWRAVRSARRRLGTT